MEALFELDITLFQLINQSWRSDYLDWLMPFWRSKYIWGPLYLFLFSFLILNFERKGWFLVFMLILSIGAADMTSSQVLKKSIKRERPCKNPMLKDKTNLLVNCGSGYSWPSSHATNHFAIATLLILTLGASFRWIKWPLFIWAFSIAYGQVYVGLHYPLDVISGMIIGFLISWIISKIIQKFRPEMINFARF